jgi:hypothetical protein
MPKTHFNIIMYIYPGLLSALSARLTAIKILNKFPIHFVMELIILVTDYGPIAAYEIRVLWKGVSRWRAEVRGLRLLY